MPRSLLSRALFAFMMLIASIEVTQATDVIIPHQGRLLDATDQPVNGPTTMTFRLYDQPTGGIALWTETQVGVLVTNGLFDSPLGSVTPLSVDVLTPAGSTPDRWLGVSIAGVELLPRMLFGTVPVAASSKRVTGDIVTGLGTLALADLNSDGRIDMVVSPESTYTAWVQDNSPNAEHFARLKIIDASSQLNLNHPDASCTMLANSVGGGIRLGGMSGSTTGTIRMMAAADSATDYLDVDSDGDGIPESSDNRTVSANAVHHNVISRNGSTTGTIRMAASPDSASSGVECDSDNDGVAESSVKLKALIAGTTSIQGSKSGSTTGTIRMATKPDSTMGYWDCDSDNDGLSESSYRIVNDGGGKRADVVMSGRSGSTTGTIRMAAAGGGGPILPSSSLDLEADLDGDGTMENTCRSIAAGAIAGIVVSSRFGSGPRQTTSMDGSFSHSHMRCDSDTDGDGVQDNSVISESGVSGASLRVISLNGLPPGVPVEDNIALIADGSSSSVALKKGVAQVGLGVVGGLVPGGSILSSRCLSSSGMDTASTEQSSDGSGAAMRAINTKGTGATVRVAATADDSGSVGTDCDDDANGFSERATWTSSNPGIARSVVAADLDADGDYDNTVVQTCDASSARMVMAGGTALTGTSGATVEASSSRSHVTTNKGDVDVSMETKDESGSYSGSFKITVSGIKSPGLKVSLNSDGIGYLSDGLGVGIPAPTHHIDVAGGAYCDGTNWVNASDKNAKENFQEVDGEELLKKISELDITKWNYKSDKETEHIGPTAQDFKATFGVGSDGKSISTIDPSGIALAAIKELYVQLKSKDKELAELRAEMAKMKKEIAKKN